MAITGASEEVQVAIGGDASSLREATDTATDALGNVRQVAGLAGAALGTLAVGGLAKATSAAASFEEEMVEVEKVTDPETAREMGDAIQEMASRMPVAQKELANITAQAGRFGIEGSENIENFTETVAKMSVATDLTTEKAGESFARLSTLMDIPIERVGDMGNVINELSNTMATSSSEITDAALRSSGTLSQMGADGEDILSLNAAMNEASESAERAGTRLRRMAQEVQDPKKVEDLAGALGMNVEEFERMRSEDPTALFREMATTMGEGGDASDDLRSSLSTTSQQALTALSMNMEGLSEAQETANQQMKDGTSLQEEYEAASSTFNSQLQVTKNRLRNVAIQIGENVLPVASEMLGYVNSAISAFSEWNESSGGMVGTIALVAGALGGFAVAAASAVSALGGMSAILGAVGGALTVLTGPVGIAIAAIALLAGAWKVNLFGIRDITDDVLGEVQEFWDAHGDSIVSEVKRTFDAILGYVETVVNFLWKNVTRPVLSKIQALWDAHGDSIVSEVKRTFDAILGYVETVVNFLWKNVTRPVLSKIQALWDAHGDSIVSEVKRTFDAILGYVETVVNFLWKNVTRPVLSKIQALWDNWGDEIMTIVDAMVGFVEMAVTNLMDGLLTVIRVGMALIRGDWEKAWNLIAGYLKRTWNRVTSFLKGDALAGIKAAISIIIAGIKTAFNYLIGTGDGTLYGDVTGIFGSIASWLEGTGKSLFSDAFSAVADAITKALEVNIDWPEPPTIVKKAANGTLGDDIDWPSRPGGGGGGGDGGGGGPILGGGPLLDTGGYVESTGRAIIHEGEEVVPEAEVDRDRGGSGSRPVTADITVYAQDGTDAGQKIVDEMDRFL